MMSFMREGGVGMWFVLALGLLSLAAAVRFAMAPDEKRVATVRSLTWATLFNTVGAIIAGFAAVGSHVPANAEWAMSPKIHLIVMVGISEALANGILGFALLSLTWLVMAVGHRRLAALG
ncbi:MAG: hypothetical protein KC776_25080 [Myxococcales bacterium]|nr:hypothetical protein [Myxococcales bacterium]